METGIQLIGWAPQHCCFCKDICSGPMQNDERFTSQIVISFQSTQSIYHDASGDLLNIHVSPINSTNTLRMSWHEMDISNKMLPWGSTCNKRYANYKSRNCSRLLNIYICWSWNGTNGLQIWFYSQVFVVVIVNHCFCPMFPYMLFIVVELSISMFI